MERERERERERELLFGKSQTNGASPTKQVEDNF
jgi:hypothetical protein